MLGSPAGLVRLPAAGSLPSVHIVLEVREEAQASFSKIIAVKLGSAY
jgi:hypothetical protein